METLEFPLDTSVEKFAQILRDFHARQSAFIHYSDKWFEIAITRVEAERVAFIMIGTERALQGKRIRKPQRLESIIEFKVLPLRSERILLTAQCNLPAPEIEKYFASFMLEIGYLFRNSEAAYAIAKRYPPDFLEQRSQELALVKASADDFLNLLKHFAASFPEQQEEVKAVQITPLDRNFPRRIEHPLTPHEVIGLSISFQTQFYLTSTWPNVPPTLEYHWIKFMELYIYPLPSMLQLRVGLYDERSDSIESQFVYGLLKYLEQLHLIHIPDPSLGTPKKSDTGGQTPSTPKSRRGGRKPLPENDWALIEIRVNGQSSDEVCPNWLEIRKKQGRGRLVKVSSSFLKATDVARLQKGSPEAGWARIKLYYFGQDEDIVYSEWREVCKKIGRSAAQLGRDTFEEQTGEKIESSSKAAGQKRR